MTDLRNNADIDWSKVVDDAVARSRPLPQVDKITAAPQNALVPYGFAPGHYTCTCNSCRGEFEGDKRAWSCMNCAVVAAVKQARAGHQPYATLRGAFRHAWQRVHGLTPTDPAELYRAIEAGMTPAQATDAFEALLMEGVVAQSPSART